MKVIPQVLINKQTWLHSAHMAHVWLPFLQQKFEMEHSRQWPFDTINKSYTNSSASTQHVHKFCIFMPNDLIDIAPVFRKYITAICIQNLGLPSPAPKVQVYHSDALLQGHCCRSSRETKRRQLFLTSHSVSQCHFLLSSFCFFSPLSLLCTLLCLLLFSSKIPPLPPPPMNPLLICFDFAMAHVQGFGYFQLTLRAWMLTCWHHWSS